jgi:hypothetical protein
MKIESCPEFRKELLDKIQAREFSERTGTHCSDLIYCVNKQAFRRIYPLPTEEDTLLLFSLGWSTQRWLTGQDKDEEPIEVDGIIVTRDCLRGTAPWELKCTFQSSARPIEENLHWVRQIMAQCYVSGTKTAYLSRLEVMGNWKSVFGKKEEKGLPENRKPTLSAYRLDFTQDELDANWTWLKQRKELFEAILATSQPLPRAAALPAGQDYECGYCPYNGVQCP